MLSLRTAGNAAVELAEVAEPVREKPRRRTGDEANAALYPLAADPGVHLFEDRLGVVEVEVLV